MSFRILGTLIALIVVEEAFHVLNPVVDWLAEIARWAHEWTDLRLALLNGVLIYGLVAIAGTIMLAISHWRGSPTERRVVRNIALLLLAGGIFGGPVSLVSALGYRAWWVFTEELGEAVVFAAMAGYVVGLVVRMERWSVPRYPDRN